PAMLAFIPGDELAAGVDEHPASNAASSASATKATTCHLRIAWREPNGTRTTQHV
ncbi:MAG TPA: hypothetical protein G4N94_09885, partial [Caldilineae bacterium]|nr:hypothetical protein [Caldilineae bacterium]